MHHCSLNKCVFFILEGLAVSDLGCLIPLVWTNVCFTPAFVSADLPFSPIEIQYLTSGNCHVTFTHVTAWITALITLERCMCITAPLQVCNKVHCILLGSLVHRILKARTLLHDLMSDFMPFPMSCIYY